jgi:hypothetical protein
MAYEAHNLGALLDAKGKAVAGAATGAVGLANPIVGGAISGVVKLASGDYVGGGVQTGAVMLAVAVNPAFLVAAPVISVVMGATAKKAAKKHIERLKYTLPKGSAENIVTAELQQAKAAGYDLQAFARGWLDCVFTFQAVTGVKADVGGNVPMGLITHPEDPIRQSASYQAGVVACAYQVARVPKYVAMWPNAFAYSVPQMTKRTGVSYTPYTGKPAQKAPGVIALQMFEPMR